MALTESRIAELENKGFKRWQKGNMDRLYINACDLGLAVVYRRTGSISDAKFQGYSISNSEAYRMKGAKTFIDVATETVMSTNRDLGKAAAELAGLEYEG